MPSLGTTEIILIFAMLGFLVFANRNHNFFRCKDVFR